MNSPLAGGAGWPRTSADRTQALDPEVAASWRRGPRWFHVVVLMLDSAGVEARRRAVIDRLGDWLIPSAPGQAHVTLFPLGVGRPADPGRSAIAAGPERFTAAREELPDEIEVVVGGADSYRSAAFLQVSAPMAAGLRQRLSARLAAGEGQAGTEAPAAGSGDLSFHPHVTVGTYQEAVPVRDVAARLADLRDLPQLRVIGRLRLVAVDARDRFGGLREV